MCGLEIDFVHKISCHGNVFRGIGRTTLDLSSTVPANSVRISPADVDMGGSRPKYLGCSTIPAVLPFLPLLFPSFSLRILLPSLPLEVGSFTYRSEEQCMLPRLGLGRSPSGNRISCFVASKSDFRWHQIYQFLLRIN